VLGLVVLAAGVSPAVSATIGATSLCLGGVKPWTAYPALWSGWWLGDALGALVVARLLLTWAGWRHMAWRLPRVAEQGAVAQFTGSTWPRLGSARMANDDQERTKRQPRLVQAGLSGRQALVLGLTPLAGGQGLGPGGGLTNGRQPLRPGSANPASPGP
jgi:hypothetical protein